MSYPEKSQLNLQTVVRDLEKRLEAIEGKLWPSDDGSGTDEERANAGQAPEVGSQAESPKAY